MTFQYLNHFTWLLPKYDPSLLWFVRDCSLIIASGPNHSFELQLREFLPSLCHESSSFETLFYPPQPYCKKVSVWENFALLMLIISNLKLSDVDFDEKWIQTFWDPRPNLDDISNGSLFANIISWISYWNFSTDRDKKMVFHGYWEKLHPLRQ